jgi:hypothetical protein
LAKPKSLPSQGRPADSLAMRSASRARSALICSLTVSSLSGLQSLHGSDAVPAAAKLIHAKVARPNNSVSALAIVLCVAAFCRLRQSKMGAGQLCRSPATDPCKSGSQREPPTKAPVGPHAGHRNRWARRWLSIVIMVDLGHTGSTEIWSTGGARLCEPSSEYLGHSRNPVRGRVFARFFRCFRIEIRGQSLRPADRCCEGQR